MIEEIILSPDKTLEYIKNNVKKHDTLELSYNRVFAPGDVLDIVIEEDWGDEALIVSLHLNGELVNDVVKVNMENIKNDLLEVRHINTDDEEIIITVE
ncbi:MAG: DUF2097 domain-containing protein [Methanobrevibacter sp.]|jgi:hypothetical protein|nr:DUF2097 domain-containing protein [Candidatus Methanovirga basalitermitum]